MFNLDAILSTEILDIIVDLMRLFVKHLSVT